MIITKRNILQQCREGKENDIANKMLIMKNNDKRDETNRNDKQIIYYINF